jgi:hypothetical protein
MTLLYSDPVILKHDTENLPESAARILPGMRRVSQFAMHAHCHQRSWSEVADAALGRSS